VCSLPESLPLLRLLDPAVIDRRRSARSGSQIRALACLTNTNGIIGYLLPRPQPIINHKINHKLQVHRFAEFFASALATDLHEFFVPHELLVPGLLI
jgi:hypothetical protein